MNENALIISTVNEGVLNSARRVVFLSRRSLTVHIQYRVEQRLRARDTVNYISHTTMRASASSQLEYTSA